MYYELLHIPFSMRTVATGARNVVAKDEQLILIAQCINYIGTRCSNNS